jgi:hypothetical protein
MRWPDTWIDPALIGLVKGTAIDYLLMSKRDDLAAVRARAQQEGIRVADPDAAPAGVEIVKGAWPGVQMSFGRGGGRRRGGGADAAGGDASGGGGRGSGGDVPGGGAGRGAGRGFGDAGGGGGRGFGGDVPGGGGPGFGSGSAGGGASSGPTGVPWVDSNGWAVRLSRTLHPESAVWVNAAPAERAFITASSYLIAIADSAAYGGRWIISLDAPLAKDLAAGTSGSLATWKSLTAAAAFFAAHKAWADYLPVGLVGVVSDFTGDNEFFSHELLNLMARAGLQYRLVLKDKVTAASFQSLRAVSYTDETPPSPDLRKQVLAFVQAGGMLIASPKWGEVAGTPVAGAERPGFSVRALGKGRIAVADEAPVDPFSWAADAAVLVSHRYDLVRFWNGGAAGSYYTMAPGGKQALVHLLFYAARGPDAATVRVAGRYRAARASTVSEPQVAKLEMEAQGDAVEVHLPQVSQYVALELDV